MADTVTTAPKKEVKKQDKYDVVELVDYLKLHMSGTRIKDAIKHLYNDNKVVDRVDTKGHMFFIVEK